MDDTKSHTTTLEIFGYTGTIRVHIHSRHSARTRRTIALAFFRQVRPFLEYFRNANISHLNHFPDFRRDEARGIYLPRYAEVDSAAGQFGFKIRMRRLELGWSQQKLARQTGLCHSHVSEVERGLCRPRRSTIMQIEKALGISLTEHLPSMKTEKPKIAEGVRLRPHEPA